MKVGDLAGRLLQPSSAQAKEPLYPRLLRLRHVSPSSWQRAVLGEGMIATGALLAMADLASAWSMVVLPVAVAGIVKAHDLLAGALAGPSVAAPVAPAGADEAVATPVAPAHVRVAEAVATPVAPAPAQLPVVEARGEAGPATGAATAVEEPGGAAATGVATSEGDPLSDELRALLVQARAAADAGIALPFVLAHTEDGPVFVTPPRMAAVLTPEERAGALRMGLVAAAASPDAPSYAVLAFSSDGERGYTAYAPGVGVVVDADLQVLNAAAPSVYP